MSLLEIKDLNISYKTRKETIVASSNVNFTLERGEILGIVGESGSGKSTIANAIINLIDPPGQITDGKIKIDNIELQNNEEIIQKIEALENLKIRGLMVIPKPRDSKEEQRQVFRKVKEIYDSLIRQGHNFDTLSMGMTSDYGVAIQEGATMIRIGTGIFGPRK